jgi:hypothetical protein
MRPIQADDGGYYYADDSSGYLYTLGDEGYNLIGNYNKPGSYYSRFKPTVSTPAPLKTDNFLGVDWSTAVHGVPITIGDTMYIPQRRNVIESEASSGYEGPLEKILSQKVGARPGETRQILDPTGKVLGYDAVEDPSSSGFFEDLFDTSFGLAKEMAPLAALAVGANVLGPMIGNALAGTGTAAGSVGSTVGITGAEAAAMGAFDAAAAAPAAVNALAAPAVNTLVAPATAQLTPAALEAAIGTPGYGYNAAAAASGITPSAGFAGMSAADFGMSGAQTTAYDAAMAAGATPQAAAAAANAAPGIGAPGATAATSAAASAAARGATAVDPFSFIIPAASSIIGGVMSANAAENAAEASGAAATRAAELQRESAREALALQERMYNEAVARQQPYYQAGTNALAQMQGRTNAMPPAFQFRPEQLTTDPGYGFRFSEGLKALERSAAARGGLLSGGTGKALTRYGQEAASQEYGNAFNRGLTEYNALRARESEEYNRLAGLAGVGGTTAQQLTSAGQNYGASAGNLLTGTAANVGNLMMNQGNTAANALLASGSAYQRSAGDIASLYARMYGPQPTYLMPGGGG